MADDPNLSDVLLDKFATHAFSLLRVAAGLRSDVLEMLKGLENDIAATIQSKGPNPKLNALLKQTNETIKTAYGEIVQSQHEAMLEVAKAESTQTANIINAAIRVSLASPVQSKQTLEAIAGKSLIRGAYPSQWWAGQSQDLQDRFAKQMRMGMLAGESVPQLINRVRGTKDKGYSDGIMQATRSQAEALVRTSVQTVSNDAKLATYKENDDVIKGIQWVSTLDSRTTPICRGLDGCTWDLHYRPLTGGKAFPGPVAHWNCRSTQIPLTKSWAELSGKKVGATDEEIDKHFQKKTGTSALAKTRASMDGQVASKMTFEDWMKTKPEDFQDQVMGAQQAALWRADKITMADLTDQANRPLTLAQLKTLVAKKELIPQHTYREGQAGISLVARGVLQGALQSLRDDKKQTTSYVNEKNGQVVTIEGISPNQDDIENIEKHDVSTVAKAVVNPDHTLTPAEIRMMGQIGIDKFHAVTLDGKVVTLKGEITPAVAEEMAKALASAPDVSPDKKLALAAKAGGLTFQKSRDGEIKVSVTEGLDVSDRVPEK